MKKLLAVATIFCAAMTSAFADETIVFIRHAEKPAQGLGQLTCQGLNRSIALPQVLLSKFDKPTAIYAPNPSVLKNDKGVDYSYIRPLATIEPTAITLGMPVNVQFAFTDDKNMASELTQENYNNSTIFVAWEHHLARKIAEDIMTNINGEKPQLPKWSDDDFDSIYVIKITKVENKFQATFTLMQQELNDLSKNCPLVSKNIAQQ